MASCTNNIIIDNKVERLAVEIVELAIREKVSIGDFKIAVNMSEMIIRQGQISADCLDGYINK